MPAQVLDEMVVQQYALPSRKTSEPVIYYRKPDHGAEAGWIVVADSQPFKQVQYLMRGWKPLAQYGLVGRANCLGSSYYKWYPILSHPNGPAEFPVSQIMEFGWHRPGGLPEFPPGKEWQRDEVFFPQLAGQEIRDYPCPHCERRKFIKAVHLADHMMRVHGWDYQTVLLLGDRLGVDFSRDFVPKVLQTYTYPAERTVRAEPERPTRPMPTVVEVEVPRLEDLAREAEQRVKEAGGVLVTGDAVVAAPAKQKRVQTPEQAERSRMALEKARQARQLKKAEREAAQMAGTQD